MQLGLFSGHQVNPCQPVAENAALAARSAEDCVQNCSADVQGSRSTLMPIYLSPHKGPTTQP